jgi:hypothetical protein
MQDPARLDRRLDRLPRSIEPPHDLWPAIEAGMGSGRNRASRWAWQAAAAVLLVVASSVLTAMLVRRPEVRQAGAPVVASDAVRVRPAAFGPGHALGTEYVAARQQLAAMLESRVDRLPASARHKLEANLAEIRRASTEINAALELAPGDPLLEELLLSTYQEELAVLASVNQLTGTNGGPASPDPKGMKL